jgi:hypothetical protein
MSNAAIVTMTLAILVLGGGLIASITTAVRAERRAKQSG